LALGDQNFGRLTLRDESCVMTFRCTSLSDFKQTEQGREINFQW